MMSARRGGRVIVHTQREIEGIRKATAATATVRDRLARSIRPGMSTMDIDRLALEFIAETGGQSAFHGYRGFPGQVCISLNDEVVHGIGSSERLVQMGDIVSLDVGVRLEGFIGDTAVSVVVGAPSDPEVVRLLDVTRKCLDTGIAAARGGCRVGDIGAAVEAEASSAGYAVVRDFVGHGCGCNLHEPPEVPNFKSSNPGPRLTPGMVLAIEPMVNMGGSAVSVDADGWTVRTRDGSLSAHFEHMVLITENKPEILTWPKMP